MGGTRGDLLCRDVMRYRDRMALCAIGEVSRIARPIASRWLGGLPVAAMIVPRLQRASSDPDRVIKLSAVGQREIVTAESSDVGGFISDLHLGIVNQNGTAVIRQSRRTSGMKLARLQIGGILDVRRRSLASLPCGNQEARRVEGALRGQLARLDSVDHFFGARLGSLGRSEIRSADVADDREGRLDGSRRCTVGGGHEVESTGIESGEKRVVVGARIHDALLLVAGICLSYWITPLRDGREKPP